MESEKPAGEAIAIINAKIVRMVAFISVMVEMIRKEFNFESRGNSIRRVIGYKEYTIMICSHCLSYLISLSFFPIWSWCCFICCNTAFLENFLGKIREVKVKLKAFIFKIEECLIEEWWFLASLWHSLPGLISFDSGNLLLCYRALINYMKCWKSGWLVAACEWTQTQESRLAPFLPHDPFYLAFVFRSSDVETSRALFVTPTCQWTSRSVGWDSSLSCGFRLLT